MNKPRRFSGHRVPHRRGTGTLGLLSGWKGTAATDFYMIPLEQTQLSATPGKLVRSYGLELRGWATGVGIRYAVALATLLAGAICFLVSVGIVLSAFFHFLEMRYGIYAGYEILGGLFLALGAIGSVIGIWLLKRHNPPLPRPRPQVETLKQ